MEISTLRILCHSGIDDLIIKEGETIPKYYPKVMKTVKTNQAYHMVQEVTGFGFAEFVGEQEPFSMDVRLKGNSLTVAPMLIGKGFYQTKPFRETVVFPKVKESASSALRSLIQTKDAKATDVFNFAFDSNYTGLDGVPLASTSHPSDEPSVGLRSNYGDGSASVSLSEAGLEAMIVAMRSRKNSRGLLYGAGMHHLTLLVPLKLLPLAWKLAVTDKQVGSNFNDKSWVSSLITVVENPYLTSNTAFFLLPSDTSTHGIKLLERERQTLDSWYDNNTRTLKFVIMEDMATYWDSWEHVQCSDGV